MFPDADPSMVANAVPGGSPAALSVHLHSSTVHVLPERVAYAPICYPPLLLSLSDMSVMKSMAFNNGSGPLFGNAEITVKGVNFPEENLLVLVDGVVHDHVRVDAQTVSIISDAVSEPTAHVIEVINTLFGSLDESLPAQVESELLMPSATLTYEQDVMVEDLRFGMFAHYTYLRTTEDISGNFHNGIVNGSISYVMGRNEFNNSAVKLQAGSFITIPAVTALMSNMSGPAGTALMSNASGFTVAAWVLMEESPRETWDPMGDSACPGFWTYNGSVQPLDSDYLPKGVWKFVAASVQFSDANTTDSTEMVYVNDVLMNSDHEVLPFLLSIANGMIALNGELDEVMIFDRALPASEIVELYRTQGYAIECSDDSTIQLQRFAGNEFVSWTPGTSVVYTDPRCDMSSSSVFVSTSDYKQAGILLGRIPESVPEAKVTHPTCQRCFIH